MLILFISKDLEYFFFHNKMLEPYFLDNIEEGYNVAVSKEERSIYQTERWIELKVSRNGPSEKMFPLIFSD